jgi:hypothetical protein
MTFMRAPVQMTVTSSEVGHVFVQPQKPVFHVELRRAARGKTPLSIEATARDLMGEITTTRLDDVPLKGDGGAVDIELPVKRRGFHEVTIRVLDAKGELLRRETTMASLPPDTRKHREDCPVGTWDFGGAHFTPSDADTVGPLYWKAGIRYGMFGFSGEERRRYGVLAGNEPKGADRLAQMLEKDPLQPQNVLIFHENAISGQHIMRPPDVFTGGTPYQFNEKEHKKFQDMWQEAVTSAKEIRQRFPKAKIAFGNGTPQLMEEFARYQFPKEYFDSRGNEAGSFMRMPETQPLDFIANNSGLWMDRQILDHYGYQDKPITQCYEICYPNTNPGNLSLTTQAKYFARHMVHSMVWGIQQVRAGIICDTGNSYYFSNWGASGICFAKPELSPKPAYVAFATITRVLDGAKFSRIIDTPTPAVYAVEFKKKDGGFVTALWTPNTARDVLLKGTAATRTDLTGNEDTLSFARGEAKITLTGEMNFVTSAKPLAVTAVPAAAEAMPTEKQFTISTLGKLEDWEVVNKQDHDLELFNFTNPRKKGDFAYSIVPEFQGSVDAMRVEPRLPVAGSKYLPMYSALILKQAAPIPDKPTEIGVMVNGNAGWGRVIFELEDAGGQRWTSIGASQVGEPTRWMADWLSPEELAAIKSTTIEAWNTNDVRGRSRINFEGWHYVRFPLPGNYEGEGYHWPNNSNWKRSGDGIVKYPLKFKRLIVEMPEKVLHLNRLVSPTRPEIYLKDLQVTYQPIEKVSAAP